MYLKNQPFLTFLSLSLFPAKPVMDNGHFLVYFYFLKKMDVEILRNI